MIRSRVARPRVTLAMISSAVRVQTNGSGWWFQFSTHVSMRSPSSVTDPKLALVSALRVRTENQVSIRFSHDDEVGVKCRCQR